MKKLVHIIIMTLAAFWLSAGATEAGVKRIWPDQLILEDSRDAYTQNTNEVGSADSTDAWFYARVKLPLGKVIKKLTYYYLNYFSTSTQVYLMRTNFTDYMEVLAIASSSNTGSGGGLVAEDDTIQNAKIKKGFAYFVRVRSANQNGLIRGIEITYK